MPSRLALTAVATAVLACQRCCAAPASGASSVRLRTEYLANPVGIDAPAPRFSWAPQAARRGAAVAAYRLVVMALADGATVWDSGSVAANATTNIAYAGAAALASDADYEWSVTWADELGAVSAPASARFSTALFAPSDWRGAQWVGGGMIRAEFNVSGAPGARVKRSRLFISVPGFYKAWINGQLTDDHELGGFTTFEERVLYDAVDVTALVVPGCNALGVLVAGGWWAQVAGIVNRPHDDSTRVVLSVTDESGATAYYASSLDGAGLAPGTLPLQFASSASPVTSSNVYGGESYDARLEQPGWASCAFTPPAGAAAWSQAGPVALDPLAPNNLTGGPFISVNSVQIKIDQDFPLVAVSPYPTGDGSWLADFGRAFTRATAHARTRARAPA